MNKLKNDLTEYYPVSFEYDIKLPDYYEVKLDIFGNGIIPSWIPPNNINFTNIKYEMLEFDLKNIEFDFKKYEY